MCHVNAPVAQKLWFFEVCASRDRNSSKMCKTENLTNTQQQYKLYLYIYI